MTDDSAAPCRRWVGPVWKVDGETCVCRLRTDHADAVRPGDPDHECTCGTWFVDSVTHPWSARS